MPPKFRFVALSAKQRLMSQDLCSARCSAWLAHGCACGACPRLQVGCLHAQSECSSAADQDQACGGRASEQELEAVTQERGQLVPKLEEARWTMRKSDKATQALQADLAAREQA